MANPTQLVPFALVQTLNPEISRLQENLRQTLLSIANSGIIDGLLIPDVALVSGSYSLIAHNLGRPARGYIVVKKNANVTVYDNENGNTQRELFVKLRASGAVTVSLWVF